MPRLAVLLIIGFIGAGGMGLFAQRWLIDWEHDRLMAQGKTLSAQYCSVCHIETDPNILPKRSWEAALGYMGYWLGINDIDYLQDHP